MTLFCGSTHFGMEMISNYSDYFTLICTSETNFFVAIVILIGLSFALGSQFQMHRQLKGAKK